MFTKLEDASWIELALAASIPTNISQTPHCLVLCSGQMQICAESTGAHVLDLLELIYETY